MKREIGSQTQQAFRTLNRRGQRRIYNEDMKNTKNTKRAKKQFIVTTLINQRNLYSNWKESREQIIIHTTSQKFIETTMYLSIIILNVGNFNSPVNRQRLVDEIQQSTVFKKHISLIKKGSDKESESKERKQSNKQKLKASCCTQSAIQ